MFPVGFPTEFPVELPCRGHCYQGDFLHIFKLLPGVTFPVLQQHLYESLHFYSCGMPFQVAPHPKPFGFVITVHTQHPVALSVAWKESTVRRSIKAQPEDQLSYSLAFETHDAIEQALHGIYRRQAWTPSRSFPRQLQGISLPVLQQHLAESPLMTTLFPMPYTVTCDPCHPDNFVVMVCPGHPRHFCKMLSKTLKGVGHRQSSL